MNELDLFSAALALTDPSEQARLINRECEGKPELRHRIEELLAAHRSANNPLDAPLEGTGAYIPAVRSAELAVGTIIAERYKIREKLGEGGMGTVYVADQTEPVQRRIALKIIKADIASDRMLARFEQERQALALMDHPNIAKVLDAGIADSSPYFVMELIKGVPITKYCDEAKLTPKQRLELFVPVCQAVQHAHQKGIIHRDLKPSNILVGLYDGNPVPKVIDFGVAKPTGAKLTDRSVYTEVGAIIGTLEYMSPEQAELNNLDIDTRSDIYALGVVLYELLTGVVPLSRKELKAAGFAEMLRIIKEVEPQKPSTRLSGSGSLPSIAACRHIEPKKLAALLRNDLDWIVMKALEKDRSRRYETANGFAMDILRYLSDEPVLAGPPSAGYRLRKFVKRNKGQVVAGLLVLLTLIAGVAGTVWGLVQAQAEKAVAIKERDDKELARKEAVTAQLETVEQSAISKEVNDFFQNRLLPLADSRMQLVHNLEPDPEVKVRTLLDRAAIEIGDQFKDRPLLAATIQEVIGNAYNGIGEYEHAIRHLTIARELYLVQRGPNDLKTISAEFELAHAHRSLGRGEEAVAILIRAYQNYKQCREVDHDLEIVLQTELGRSYVESHQPSKAIELLEPVVSEAEKQFGPNHLHTLGVMIRLAQACRDIGRDGYSVELLTEARKRSVSLPSQHFTRLLILHELANSYAKVERFDEAIALLREIRGHLEKTLGLDHPHSLIMIGSLGSVYVEADRPNEGVPVLEQIDAIWKKRGEGGGIHALINRQNLAQGYARQGKSADALRLKMQIQKDSAKRFGEDSARYAQMLHDLAVSLEGEFRFDEAIQHWGRALAIAKRKLEPNDDLVLFISGSFGRTLTVVGRPEEAIALIEPIHRSMTRSLSHDRSAAQLVRSLALAYMAVDRDAEAIALMETLQKEQRKSRREQTEEMLLTDFQLAQIYTSSGRVSEAIPIFERIVKYRKERDGLLNRETTNALHELARACHEAGRLEYSILLMEEARDLRMKVFGPKHPAILPTLNNLSIAYIESKRNEEGLRLKQTIVDLSTELFGPESRQVQEALDGLGVGFSRCGYLDKAIVTGQRSYDLAIRLYGRDNRETIRTMLNLAVAHSKAQQYDKAVRLFSDALDIRKDKPADDKYRLRAMAELAICHMNAKRPAEAISLLKSASEIQTRTKGPNDPETRKTILNLAKAHTELKQFAEAIPLLETLHSSKPSRVSADNSQPLRILMALSHAYENADRLPEAIQLLEGIKGLNDRFIDTSDRDQLESLNNLGVLYHSANRLAETIRLFEKLREAELKYLGPDDVLTLACSYSLAEAYLQLGREREAVPIFEFARRGLVKKHGLDHEHSMAATNNLAKTYIRIGKYSEALAMLDELLPIAEKKFGIDHANVLNSQLARAEALAGLNRLPEGVALLNRILEIQKKDPGLDKPATSHTVAVLTHLYCRQERFDDAIQLRKEYLDAIAIVRGANDRYSLVALNDLGTTYWRAKQFDKSVPLFEDALERSKKNLGPEDAETISRAFDLAINYRDSGKSKEAIALIDEWLPRSRKKFGLLMRPTDLGVDTAIDCYVNSKRWDDALTLLQAVSGEATTSNRANIAHGMLTKTLTAMKKSPGEDDPRTWSVMQLLGKLLRGSRKFAQAQALLEEVRQKRTIKFGPDHSETLSAAHELAMTLSANRQYAKAIALLESTVEKRARVLGPNARDTLTSMFRLAAAYLGDGQLEKSMELETEVLKRQKIALPPNDQATLTTMNNLAAAKWRMGRYTESVALFEDLLRVQRKFSGEDRRQTILVAFNLASNYISAGRMKDAEQIMREWLPRAREKLGFTNRTTIMGTHLAARLLHEQGKPEQAEPMLRELFSFCKDNLDSDDQDNITTHELLGGNLVRQNRFAEAELLYREALKFREKLQSTDWQTSRARLSLGQSLLGQQKPDAEKFLQDGYSGIKQREKLIGVPQRTSIAKQYEQIAKLYENVGKKDQAAQWKKRIESLPESGPTQKPPRSN